MKRALTLLILLALLAGAGCATTSGPGGGPASDSTLPIFKASDIDGGTFDLADHLGKEVVLISFWATYCEPCKAEMPVLEQLQQQYGERGLKILSVSLDGADSVSGVKPHIKKNGYSFAVVVDEDGTIAQAYTPAATAPFTVIIGKNGRVAKRIEGFQASEVPVIEGEIKALLGLSE